MDTSEAKERLLEATRGGETIVMFGETVKASVSPKGDVYKVEVTGFHPKGFPHWDEGTSVASWEGPEVDEAAKRVVDALAGTPAKMVQERGKGKGAGGPPQGDGGADQCVCPECDATAAHEKGVPCNEMKCPECGAAMRGTSTEKKEVVILAENVSLADLVWVTKPYDKLSDAPENIRELDGAKLTLAQVNWIANMADGLEGQEGIESPWAVAKARFKKSFKKEGDKWVKPKEEKKKKEATAIAEKELSLEQVQEAFYGTFSSPQDQVETAPRVWTKATFPTFVVAEDKGKLYRVPYTVENDTVVFAARSDWEQVLLRYEPVPVRAEEGFWGSKGEPTARMFLTAAKAYLQRKESETVVWQEGDRRFYLGLVSLPSIKDKEEEVVEMEGADFSIALAKKYGYRSGLYIKHVVPQSLVGRSISERRIGPFWVEFGEFEDTTLADWAFRILENDREGKWRFSIGFITPKKQALVGRYTRLLKFDSTITEEPAQPLTAMLALIKKEGGTIMDKDQSIQKMMVFLNPGTDEEKEQVNKMLGELFEVSEKELVAISKQSESVEKVREAIEGLEDEGLKSMLIEAIAKAKPPKKKADDEEDDEDEEEANKKKKKELEVALEPLVAAVKDLTDRVEKVEASAGSAALQELRQALLTRSKDYPKPSDKATEVPDGAALLKQLEKMLNPQSVGKHPLASFAGGPAPAEGG